MLRAQMLLGVDAPRWRRLDPMIAFAWALQSIAKPTQTGPNPPLPRETVREQARQWLPLREDALDQAFLSGPYPWSGPYVPGS